MYKCETHELESDYLWKSQNPASTEPTFMLILFYSYRLLVFIELFRYILKLVFQI